MHSKDRVDLAMSHREVRCARRHRQRQQIVGVQAVVFYQEPEGFVVAASSRSDGDAMSGEVGGLMDLRVGGDHELIGVEVERRHGVDAAVALHVGLHAGEVGVSVLEKPDVLGRAVRLEYFDVDLRIPVFHDARDRAGELERIACARPGRDHDVVITDPQEEGEYGGERNQPDHGEHHHGPGRSG